MPSFSIEDVWFAVAGGVSAGDGSFAA